MGPRQDGRLDRDVPTPCGKSASRPLLFALSSSASAFGPELLGKSLGRREPRENGEGQRIRPGVGEGLARCAR